MRSRPGACHQRTVEREDRGLARPVPLRGLNTHLRKAVADTGLLAVRARITSLGGGELGVGLLRRLAVGWGE
jgi:hypothetical protein